MKRLQKFRALAIAFTVACAIAVLHAASDSDSFTYSNGELETVSSANWERWNTALPGLLNVVSNKVGNDATSVTNSVYIWHTTYSGPDYFTQIVADTLGANWEMGLFLHAGSKGGTYTGYILYCYDAGGSTVKCGMAEDTAFPTNTNLVADTTVTIVAGDILKFTSEGTSLKFYINGSVQSGFTVTNNNKRTGRLGFYIDSTGGGAWRVDSWQGGDISSGTVKPCTITLMGVGIC